MCSNIPASPAYGVYISDLTTVVKNDADEAVSVVYLTSSSGGYINGRNSANLELLIDKTGLTPANFFCDNEICLQLY
jgi:hypothetical protein